eukprot:tig00000455_g991.t1
MPIGRLYSAVVSKITGRAADAEPGGPDLSCSLEPPAPFDVSTSSRSLRILERLDDSANSSINTEKPNATPRERPFKATPRATAVSGIPVPSPRQAAVNALSGRGTRDENMPERSARWAVSRAAVAAPVKPEIASDAAPCEASNALDAPAAAASQFQTPRVARPSSRPSLVPSGPSSGRPSSGGDPGVPRSALRPVSASSRRANPAGEPAVAVAARESLGGDKEVERLRTRVVELESKLKVALDLRKVLSERQELEAQRSEIERARDRRIAHSASFLKGEVERLRAAEQEARASRGDAVSRAQQAERSLAYAEREKAALAARAARLPELERRAAEAEAEAERLRRELAAAHAQREELARALAGASPLPRPRPPPSSPSPRRPRRLVAPPPRFPSVRGRARGPPSAAASAPRPGGAATPPGTPAAGPAPRRLAHSPSGGLTASPRKSGPGLPRQDTR